MSQITKEEIEKLAELSKISLTEEEKESYQKDLSSILTFVERLNEIDTKNIEATSQVTGLTNVMREDEVKEEEKDVKEKLITDAPRTYREYVEVPAVLKKS